MVNGKLLYEINCIFTVICAVTVVECAIAILQMDLRGVQYGSSGLERVC